jgi:hypothetical protein
VKRVGGVDSGHNSRFVTEGGAMRRGKAPRFRHPLGSRRRWREVSVLDNVNGVQFGTGLLVVLVAALLLLLDILESGVAGAMLIIGVGLVAASGNWT